MQLPDMTVIRVYRGLGRRAQVPTEEEESEALQSAFTIVQGFTGFGARGQVPDEQAESEALLAETRSADALEAQYAADLDFGGIHTSQA